MSVNAIRRRLLRAAAALPAFGIAGCASTGGRGTARRIVVVGGGYGGATAARYATLWGGDAIDVTLVERDAAFVSCPLSNLVLAGSRSIADVTIPYASLARLGVTVISDTAVAIDADSAGASSSPAAPSSATTGWSCRRASTSSSTASKACTTTHSARCCTPGKAGPQTVALRRQLEAMPDGGVFAISIPRAPYRCPPGPYERACQAAWYFQRAKPRSKVLILDGNEDVQSKKALFMKAWSDEFKGIVEYRPEHVLTGVDAKTMTARFETADDVKADVLNVIPPQSAGAIARQAGVITVNDQWCEVDFLTFESIRVPGIHVLGDSIQTAPLMPKSGHMANQHGKVAAAAIVAALTDQPVDPAPMLNNTCYSFINDREAVHIASVHRYDAAQKTFLTVPGSGGLSTAKSAREGEYGFAWARAIWKDMLG